MRTNCTATFTQAHQRRPFGIHQTAAILLAASRRERDRVQDAGRATRQTDSRPANSSGTEPPTTDQALGCHRRHLCMRGRCRRWAGHWTHRQCTNSSVRRRRDWPPCDNHRRDHRTPRWPNRHSRTPNQTKPLTSRSRDRSNYPPVSRTCCRSDPGQEGPLRVPVQYDAPGEDPRGVHDHGVTVTTKPTIASSPGRHTSLPDALSTKVRSNARPSSWRAVLWSRVLTLT